MFSTEGIAEGIYFIRTTLGQESSVEKLILVKYEIKLYELYC